MIEPEPGALDPPCRGPAVGAAAPSCPVVGPTSIRLPAYSVSGSARSSAHAPLCFVGCAVLCASPCRAWPCCTVIEAQASSPAASDPPIRGSPLVQELPAATETSSSVADAAHSVDQLPDTFTFNHISGAAEDFPGDGETKELLAKWCDAPHPPVHARTCSSSSSCSSCSSCCGGRR
jgi:hypothetical protein